MASYSFTKALLISFALTTFGQPAHAANDTLVIPLPSQAKKHINAAPDFVPGELIVKYKEYTDEVLHGLATARPGLEHVKYLDKNQRLALVRMNRGQLMAQAMHDLRANPAVDYVQPNYVYQIQATPDDPEFDQLWGLQNTAQTVDGVTGSANSDINATAAWDHITDCSSVVVAVTDTGVNYTHVDLADNIWNNTDEVPSNGIDDDANGYIDDQRGWDFVNDDNDPIPDSAAEIHGTHVAGTIGAEGNNATGITGICWNVRIMPLRVLGKDGTGTTAGVIEGLEYAIDNGAGIINMSFGGSSEDQAFSDAITTALNNDVVIVAAAGNFSDNNDNSTTPLFPCNYPQANVICVAALDQSYNLASFSNFGTTSVDVGAPGINIESTWPGQTLTDSMTSWTRDGGWDEITCTLSNGSSINLVANPGSYCSGGGYNTNLEAVAYKTFDLSSFSDAGLSFISFYQLEPNNDKVALNVKDSGGDPFSGGTELSTFSGETLSGGNVAQSVSVDLSGCLSSNCSIGFKLTSNGTSTEDDRGFAVGELTISSVENGSNTYDILDGTSMATPHVSGIAAMARAFNPGYTYLDTVNAVKLSGDSINVLSNLTTTGRAVDAYKAIQYINPPRNVTAQIVD